MKVLSIAERRAEQARSLTEAADRALCAVGTFAHSEGYRTYELWRAVEPDAPSYFDLSAAEQHKWEEFARQVWENFMGNDSE